MPESSILFTYWPVVKYEVKYLAQRLFHSRKYMLISNVADYLELYYSRGNILSSSSRAELVPGVAVFFPKHCSPAKRMKSCQLCSLSEILTY